MTHALRTSQRSQTAHALHVRRQVDWLSDPAYKSVQRLKSELDPLRVTASHCTDHDALVGSLASLLHAGLRNVEEDWECLLACPVTAAVGTRSHDPPCHAPAPSRRARSPPASSTSDARHAHATRSLLARDTPVTPTMAQALCLKYVEVSCRTNEDVHALERVMLRGLKLLPPIESIKSDG